jgi:DNA-binding SARP family transcriptional activator
LALIKELDEESAKFSLQTPEILKLKTYIGQAEEWITKAQDHLTLQVSLKDLDKILKHGKSLPLNFEQVYSDLEARHKKALAL